MAPRPEIARKISLAFLAHGYDQLNMTGLAKAVDLTRRALYNHFSAKEEAFRFMIRQLGEESIAAGLAAGREALEAGGDAVDVLTAVVNIRYGEARRRLLASPHATEINDQAFRRCRDLMIEAAETFQRDLAALIVELGKRKLLTLKPAMAPETLAQLLADGARGTNQSLPPVTAEGLEPRYRLMTRTLLEGAAQPAKSGGARAR
jgi:AcrR family transcriptional regulator